MQCYNIALRDYMTGEIMTDVLLSEHVVSLERDPACSRGGRGRAAEGRRSERQRTDRQPHGDPEGFAAHATWQAIRAAAPGRQ